jgi:hypothetical protein
VSRKVRMIHANHRVAGMYSKTRIAAGPCIIRTPFGSTNCHDSWISCAGIRATQGVAASSSRLRSASRWLRSSLATSLAAALQNGQPPSNMRTGRLGSGTSASHEESKTKRFIRREYATAASGHPTMLRASASGCRL